MKLLNYLRLRLWPRKAKPIHGADLLAAASMAQVRDDGYAAETEKMKLIREKIDADPDAYLSQTSALRPEDFALMGKLIQNYCYVDLNARRIIDSIRLAALGPDERYGGSLQDAQVIPKLKEAAEMLPAGDVREGVIKAADSIVLHVRHRHNFAHWAARRIKKGGYFVMFTKNAKEVEKLLGTKPPPEVMTYCLVPIEPLHVELSILEKQGLYLAQAASWIDMDSAKYKSFFDQKRADQQKAKYEAGKTKRGAKGPLSLD